jgi:hypothetical protein
MRRTQLAILLLALTPAPAAAQATSLSIESGLESNGTATPRWLSMLRRRLDDSAYANVAGITKPLTGPERAWDSLARSRASSWEHEIPALAAPWTPVVPPARVTVVLGNRGANDAFTHDSVTIGFDLAVLQEVYGDTGPDDAERLDRLFRHEFDHLMQKAALARRPYAAKTPQDAAALEMWLEGLGTWRSLSSRWRATDGRDSETAARALKQLEPVLVERMTALACATPERAKALTADLSWGPFEKKWGALVPALWLEREVSRTPESHRQLIQAGPDGIWALAERNLQPTLRPSLSEARAAASRCP